MALTLVDPKTGRTPSLRITRLSKSFRARRKCKLKLKTMISRADLLSSMEKSGYPLTSRRLTDWPKKHLIETPRAHGRGHGKGKRYWTDPEILERCQFLHDVLAHGVTSKDALLMLAWAGFPVPAKLVRRHWISRLASFQKNQERNVETRGYADDMYWELAVRLSPRLSKEHGYRRDDLELIVGTVLTIVYAMRDYQPRGELIGEVTRAANAFIRAHVPNTEAAKAIEIDGALIWRLTWLVRRAISVAETLELLKGTDLSQFEEALNCLRLTVRLVMALTLPSANGPEALTGRAIFRAIIGPTLLALFLRLIVDGHVKKVEKTKRLFEQTIQKIKSVPVKNRRLGLSKSGSELQEIARALLDGIGDIWHGFNLFKLYNIPQFPPISHDRKIISSPGKS